MTPPEPPTHADVITLLLAAGSSSRMGESKQLLDVSGMPLLRYSAKIALEARTSGLIVVLGANETPHREALAGLPVDIIVNHYWKSGMGSSIKTSLHHIIRAYPEASAVLIMVCDQPSITSDHLSTLIRTYARADKKIVASAYADTLGVPAIFGRPFFSNILMLRDDQGAKRIIEQFAQQVTAVQFPDGAIDLDTKDDYARFLDNQRKS